MVFVGIDPGKTGGIAFVTVADDSRVTLSVEPVRLETLTDQEIFHELESRLASSSVHEIVCYLEDPRGVIPGPRTPKSIAGPAESFGFIRGLLVASQWPIHLVRPQEWQKAFKLPSRKSIGDKAKKRAHREAAQRLFPDLRPTNWSADALLLAELARRSHAKT